jgi:predicted transcriptional regulator
MSEESSYRSRCRIYADILRAIQATDQSKVTYLLHEANLSYERLTHHLGKMKELGLIESSEEGESVVKITAKGSKYLTEFRKIEEFGETFGITV